MPMYEVTMECKIKKLVTLKAKNEDDALEKAKNFKDVEDELEVGMDDWEVVDGPHKID